MLHFDKLIEEVNKIDFDLSIESQAIMHDLASEIARECEDHSDTECATNQYVEDLIIDLFDDNKLSASEAFEIIRTINIALRNCRY